MPADFDIAIKTILKHEGGFSNNPNDSGGPTNYGISLRFLKEHHLDINFDGVIDIKDIKDISRQKAILLYKEHWWDKYKYEKIDSTVLATKVFDTSVNTGPSVAHKILQRCINIFLSEKLSVDGILGKKTIASVNKLIESGKMKELYICFQSFQESFYQELVSKNKKNIVFLKGWINRART